MDRRKFVKKLGFAAGLPIAFHGVPLKVLGGYQSMQRLAAASDNDKVLIILQMHGGNDGLNTFIPLEAYDQYYSRRANVAIPYKVGNRTLIPLDSTAPTADQIGLHPDMQDFKYMYDIGRAAVFQGVSYEKNNGSHFRGRDIWFMGGGADDYFPSGWIGRYLSNIYLPETYPDDFPNTDMPDPLALEMGNDVSLLFHQEGNIPTSLSLGSSPGGLASLIDSLEGFTDEGVDPRGLPPTFLDGSPYGKEMDWILGLEDKSETYIKRLVEIYDAATDTAVTYPENYPFLPASSRNPLTSQLQLVARLLAGGLKTKVFLLKIGGFDTHAQQVVQGESTMGGHAALLYYISSAMRAFNEDLNQRGISDRVLTMSMSEFGRRIGSNGSYGTDHGTGGPIMMWGAGLRGGIYGTNPDLSLNNVSMQFDYRQIYANILFEWMGVDQTTLTNDIFFGDYVTGPDLINGGTYTPMDLISDVITGQQKFRDDFYRIEKLYPNPATNYTQIDFFINDIQEMRFELINLKGAVLSSFKRKLNPGKHTVSLVLDQFSNGIYFVRVTSEKLNETRKLIIQ
ncbi:MAG: DUF1501 domain-containing protein [Cyclobacteriaceae bacterium]